MITGLLSAALAEQASAADIEAALAREAPDAAGELDGLAEVLAGYLGALPGAIDALTTMARGGPFERSVAFVAGQVLVYLVDEDDLFDDEDFGALGLLDDAYLVHSSVAVLRAAFPALDVPDGYAAPSGEAHGTVRALLPDGVGEALDRTVDRMVLVASALFTGGGRAAAIERPRPTVRVANAVASLSSAVTPSS
jgi:hypothetical protein